MQICIGHFVIVILDIIYFKTKRTTSSFQYDLFKETGHRIFPGYAYTCKNLFGFFSAYLPKCILPCSEGMFQIFLLVVVTFVEYT